MLERAAHTLGRSSPIQTAFAALEPAQQGPLAVSPALVQPAMGQASPFAPAASFGRSSHAVPECPLSIRISLSQQAEQAQQAPYAAAPMAVSHNHPPANLPEAHCIEGPHDLAAHSSQHQLAGLQSNSLLPASQQHCMSLQVSAVPQPAGGDQWLAVPAADACELPSEPGRHKRPAAERNTEEADRVAKRPMPHNVPEGPQTRPAQAGWPTGSFVTLQSQEPDQASGQLPAGYHTGMPLDVAGLQAGQQELPQMQLIPAMEPQQVVKIVHVSAGCFCAMMHWDLS